MSALPFHPVVNAFPVVTTVLAAGCVLAGAARPGEAGREWLRRALLLLLVALLAMPAVAWSGRAWAASAGLWPKGLALPPAKAQLLRGHVAGATLSLLLMALAALLVSARIRGRGGRWLVLAVVLACALSTGLTAHLGGKLAFSEPEVEDAP